MCRINKEISEKVQIYNKSPERKEFTPIETSVKKVSHGKFRTGFTLIEIFLVAAMLSVVGLTIYSSFNQGIKLWQRLIKTTPASGANIFFAKISSDLRNSFEFSGIDFVGAKSDITFPALVLNAREEGPKVLSIAQVGYSFDTQTESLNRWEQNYSQLYQNRTTLLRQMVNGVKSLKFHYYYYDSEQEIYIWKDNWQKEEKSLPLAVRIRLGFDEDTKRKEITRTITIPAGG